MSLQNYLTKDRARVYLIPIVAVIVTLGLKLLLGPVLEGSPFLLFFGTVTLCAWIGGLRAGLLTTLLAALLVTYFLLEPVGTFGLMASKIVAISLFTAECLVISLIAEHGHQALRQLSDELLERWHAENALRENDKRFRLVTEATGAMVYDLSLPDGRVHYAHRKEELMGYPADTDKMNVAWYAQQMHPDDLEAYQQVFNAAAAKRRDSYFVAYRLRHKDGHYMFVEETTRLLYDGAGQPVRVLGSVVDVSERRRTESALAEQLRLNQAVMQTAPAMLHLVTLEGHNIFMSPYIEEVLGISADKLVGEDTSHIPEVHPEDIPTLAAHFDAHKTAIPGTIMRVEYRMRHADGSWRWIMTQNTVFTRDEAGEPTQLIGVSLDITTQKQQEMELRASKNRFERMANTTPAMIWMSGPQGLATFLSQAWCDFTGMSMEEGLGLGWIETMHPDDRAAGVATLSEARTGRKPFQMDVRFRRADGTYAPTMSIGRPLFNEDGTFEGFIGSVVDLTERAQMVAALDQSEQRYMQLFETMSEAFALCEIVETADGVDYRVVDVNPAFQQATGVNPEKATNRSINDVAPRVERELLERCAGVVESNESLRFEYFAVDFDRWYDVQVFRAGEKRFGVLFSNISERKDAEQAVRVSEERLRLATEAVRGLIYEWNMDDDTTYRSEGLVDLLGYHPDEVPKIGAWWTKQIHPEDRQPADQALADAVAAQARTMNVEYRILHRDRYYVWVWEHARLFYGHDGQVSLLIGTTISIDDRKRTEEALRQSEARFRVLAETVPGILFTNRPDGANDYISNQFYEYTGLEPGQGEGFNWVDVLHPDDQERTQRHWMYSVTTGQPYDIEYRFRGKEGGYRWFLARSLPVRDEDGQIVKWMGTVFDIHDQKQNEMRTEQLHVLTTGLATALSVESVLEVMSRQAFVIMGGSRGSIGLFGDDPEMLHMRAYNYDVLPRELLGSLTTVSIKDSTPLTDAINSGKGIWIETLDQYRQLYPEWVARFQQYSGTQALIALPLIGKDSVIGGLGLTFNQPQHFNLIERSFMLSVAQVCAQALERAQLFEAEQRARAEAEEANRLKTQFLGMVSHELRTPLTSIKGFVDTLLAEDVSFDEEEQRDFLLTTSMETDKLSSLVEQLLDMSRLQAGRLHIEPYPQTLADVLRVAAMEMAMLARDHNLVMDVEGNPPRLIADRQRVGQVLVNLVGNAAKFSPLGSTITVKAEEEGDFIRFDVKDEGSGIPPEAREYIFEAFRQTEIARASHSKGAGLGLAICKGLVEAHGGRIWVQDNVPGPGVTFSFTIPAEQ